MRQALLSCAILGLLATPALAIVWEWHCDVDPTTIDTNGDGVMDWIVRNGNPFDTGGLTAGGTWHATHQFAECVDTRPRNDFNTPTTVDLRWRSYGEGAWQSTFWVNMDYSPTCSPGTSGYTFAPIYAHLELMSDDTQTLTLYNVFRSWEAQVLAQYTGLPNDFVDFHMDFDTAADTVSVSLDGVPQGTYGYGVFGPQNADNFATVLGANGEFDYVRIEAQDPLITIIPEPSGFLIFLLGGVLLVACRWRKRR